LLNISPSPETIHETLHLEHARALFGIWSALAASAAATAAVLTSSPTSQPSSQFSPQSSSKPDSKPYFKPSASRPASRPSPSKLAHFLTATTIGLLAEAFHSQEFRFGGQDPYFWSPLGGRLPLLATAVVIYSLVNGALTDALLRYLPATFTAGEVNSPAKRVTFP
jgi:hypothetical protein